MAPRKSDVGDEEAWEWLQRHRRRHSFRKIGADSGRDPRYVAKVVRRLEQAVAVREAEGARSLVAAESLKRHLEDIEEAAWEVLRALAPPTLREGSLTPLPGYSDMTNVVVTSLAGHFGAGYGRYRDPLRDRAANVRAQVAFEGLKEHLSEQSQRWQVVHELQQACRHYCHAWQDAQKSYGGDIEEAIREIRSRPNARPRPNTPTAFLEVIGYLEDVERLFAEVEGILNPPQLRRILLATRCRHCPLP